MSDAQVDCNARALRIYEPGEALQYLRSVVRRFCSLTKNIQEVSFDLLHSHGNPVANHSMTAIKGGLEARANIRQKGQIKGLPGKPDCKCFQDRRPENRSPEAAVCLANGNREIR